ncbi:MAG: DnaA regulatory inactivator Hda [Betaproteobacteria bacterium]|nr:DnaA regulatory inactivator Hda [Betaproteobacteria bacterium]
MQQLPLEISRPPEPTLDNFIPGANAEALARVRALAAGVLDETIVYLWGRAGTGRSHLLQAAARAAAGRLVCADDVSALDASGQQALFNAINAARAGDPPVLAAGDAPPAQLALRADLASRLGWGLVYQLQPLTDAHKAEWLSAEARRRGLPLGDGVIDYLLTRLPRDLPSLATLLERLDRYALARKRPITLPLVREFLQTPPQ